MIFYNTDNLPINKEYKDFRNKSSKKSDIPFNGQILEYNQNSEISKVNLEHIKAYFGSNLQKKTAPLTYEELSELKLNPYGTKRFPSKNEQTELIELSKKYPLAVRNLLKHSDGLKPRFENFEIRVLAEKYEKNPEAAEKLINIKKSDNTPKFSGHSIVYLFDTYLEHPYAVEKLSEYINEDEDNPRFSIVDIKYLAKTYEENPDIVEELAAIKNNEGLPKFNGLEINYAAKLFKNKELKAFFIENADKIESIKSNCSDNFFEINLSDKKIHVQTDADGNCKIIGTEKQKRDENKAEIEMAVSNGNIKTEYYSKNGSKEYREYIETVFDKYGNTISRTSLRPHVLNDGMLVVYKEIYDEDENLIEVKDLATVRNYGEYNERRKVERNYTSPLGTESRQIILEIPKGRRSEIHINNTVFHRLTKKIDENITETYAWGNKYIAKFNGDSTEITAIKKDGTTDTVVFNNEKIDYLFRPLLKKLPADCLYTTAKFNTKLSVECNMFWDNNAYFDYNKNEIALSLARSNDLFTFAHEYGHFLDDIVMNNLNQDKVLKKVFLKELDAYKTQSTGMNEEQINYFISKIHKNKNGCLTELIAESTAILLGLPHCDNHLLLRGKILQENFPETIEYIGNKIQEAMA